MIHSKSLLGLAFFLCINWNMSGQDCTLDIGGKNTETIIKVFQLNDAQKATMETLRAELETQTKSIEEDIEKLFEEHPQSSQEELLVLANKYKELQLKMMDLSRESDRKLLSVFNEKQYERYRTLCYEAVRKPLKVIPTTPVDSIPPK